MSENFHLNPPASAERRPLFPEEHAVEILASRRGGEVLQVLDDSERRWLKYRYGALQSAMHKRHPERMVLPYTRAMASSLMFVENPERILVLGLGGGSFVRFLLHHYPAVRVTVVERETDCINIAHELFQVPRDDSRLEIIAGDARDVVPRLQEKYAFVLVDLFLAHGPPSWLGTADLFIACRARMAGDAVLCANLWADPHDEDMACLRGVTSAFDSRVLWIPVSGYRNLIALAFAKDYEMPELALLRSRALSMSKSMHFDGQAQLRSLERTNRVEHGHLIT